MWQNNLCENCYRNLRTRFARAKIKNHKKGVEFIMAIYHFSGSTISRGKGQSAIASASYRSGEKLYSERYDESNFYAREVKPVTFIFAPEHAPEWATNREKLWNEVEKVEKQWNAQLAREFNVALPIELTDKEQEELTKEFVIKNFVERGMVADVAIHRDDKNNPHFHVMLTIRPFESDGSWGAKAKKIYITDEQGNRTKTESGYYRSYKEYTTDWNSKDTLKEWRNNWADTTNKYLERAGFSERITEKSYVELGLDNEPSIHEGHVAREMEERGEISDRCQENRDISARNLARQNSQKEGVSTKQEKAIRDVLRKEYAEEERTKTISKSLSPQEKKGLAEVAKYLKVYVTYDNLIDKERMLRNWSNKVEINNIVEDIDIDEKTISNLKATKHSIDLGKEILEKQADRIYKKYYPELAENKNYNNYYKIAIANKTIQNDRVLSKEEIATTLIEASENRLEYMMKSVAKNPYIKSVQSYQKDLKDTVEKLKVYDEKTVLTDDEKEVYKDLLKTARTQRTSLNILNSYYTETIQEKHPSFDVNSLKVREKEALSKAIDYYGGRYSLDKIYEMTKGKPENKYSYHERIIGVDMIIASDSRRFSDIMNRYIAEPETAEIWDTVSNNEMRKIFIEEVLRQDNDRDEAKQKLIKHQEEKVLSEDKNNDYSEQSSFSDNRKTRSYQKTSTFVSLFGRIDLLSSLAQAQADNIRREREDRRDRKGNKTKNKEKNKATKQKRKNNNLSL